MAQSLDPAPADASPPLTARAPARDLVWVALVVVGVAVIYAPGLANLPVFDDAYFTEGEVARRFASFELQPRMLSYGSFLWLQAIFGDGLWKQRLFNGVLHLGVVAALWGFYREILRAVVSPAPDPGEPPHPYHESPGLGFAVGFFALNPMAIYAVAYVIQRSIVMATLFVVCGLWCFAHALRTRRLWMHAAAIACYAAAVLSKENAVLAPLVALPIYILVARPTGKRLAMVLGVSALLVTIAAALLWRQMGQILGTPFDEFSRVYLRQLAALEPSAPDHALGLSIENQMWLFFAYGVRWFLPFGEWMSMSMRPPFPLTWMSFPHVLGVIGYVAVVVAGFWLLARERDWRALLGFSILAPALLFGTEFLTVWVQDPFVLYRSYLWAIGVPGLVLLAVHGTSARALLVVGVFVGLLLAWQAVERVLSLATPETAWGDAIKKLPNDPRAVGRWFPYLNRGSYYADRDRFELAVRDFETSASLGDMGMGAFNIGSILVATGKPQQALRLFDAAQKQGYDLWGLWFQRGLAYAALNQPDRAYEQFAGARHLQPPSPTREIVLLQLGRAALQTGHREDAISSLTEFLKSDPRNNEARYLLAMAYITGGQNDKGLEVLREAAEGGPIHYARALAYYGMGRKPDAQREIETAIRIGPDNPALHQWQAKINAMR